MEILEAVAAKAAAELDRLAGLAGIAAADSAKLDTICDRLRALQALQADEQQLVMSLQAPGDGLPENELRAAWMEQDFDAIRADLATKQEHSRTLESNLEQAIEGAVAARGTFEAHHEEIGVNGAAAARESAVAELHDVIERYVDLSLARDLLKCDR